MSKKDLVITYSPAGSKQVPTAETIGLDTPFTKVNGRAVIDGFIPAYSRGLYRPGDAEMASVGLMFNQPVRELVNILDSTVPIQPENSSAATSYLAFVKLNNTGGLGGGWNTEKISQLIKRKMQAGEALPIRTYVDLLEHYTPDQLMPAQAAGAPAPAAASLNALAAQSVTTNSIYSLTPDDIAQIRAQNIRDAQSGIVDAPAAPAPSSNPEPAPAPISNIKLEAQSNVQTMRWDPLGDAGVTKPQNAVGRIVPSPDNYRGGDPGTVVLPGYVPQRAETFITKYGGIVIATGALFIAALLATQIKRAMARIECSCDGEIYYDENGNAYVQGQGPRAMEPLAGGGVGGAGGGVNINASDIFGRGNTVNENKTFKGKESSKETKVEKKGFFDNITSIINERTKARAEVEKNQNKLADKLALSYSESNYNRPGEAKAAPEAVAPAAREPAKPFETDPWEPKDYADEELAQILPGREWPDAHAIINEYVSRVIAEHLARIIGRHGMFADLNNEAQQQLVQLLNLLSGEIESAAGRQQILDAFASINRVHANPWIQQYARNVLLEGLAATGDRWFQYEYQEHYRILGGETIPDEMHQQLPFGLGDGAAPRPDVIQPSEGVQAQQLASELERQNAANEEEQRRLELQRDNILAAEEEKRRAEERRKKVTDALRRAGKTLKLTAGLVGSAIKVIAIAPVALTSAAATRLQAYINRPEQVRIPDQELPEVAGEALIQYQQEAVDQHVAGGVDYRQLDEEEAEESSDAGSLALTHEAESRLTSPETSTQPMTTPSTVVSPVAPVSTLQPPPARAAPAASAQRQVPIEQELIDMSVPASPPAVAGGQYPVVPVVRTDTQPPVVEGASPIVAADEEKLEEVFSVVAATASEINNRTLGDITRFFNPTYRGNIALFMLDRARHIEENIHNAGDLQSYIAGIPGMEAGPDNYARMYVAYRTALAAKNAGIDVESLVKGFEDRLIAMNNAGDFVDHLAGGIDPNGMEVNIDGNPLRAEVGAAPARAAVPQVSSGSAQVIGAAKGGAGRTTATINVPADARIPVESTAIFLTGQPGYKVLRDSLKKDKQYSVTIEQINAGNPLRPAFSADVIRPYLNNIAQYLVTYEFKSTVASRIEVELAGNTITVKRVFAK